MIRLYLLILAAMVVSCKTKKIPMSNQNLLTQFERHENYSATYFETIDFYKSLAAVSDIISISEYGMTDAGYPLHDVVVDMDGKFDPQTSRSSGKAILFINNGIHPGEPCGVDASMMLLRDIANGKVDHGLLKNTVIVLIPVYNIGGALNRNSHTRTNQIGPEAYGFRGNAKNLDLNRDFIKCDSKNAQSFNQLYNKWNPDVFIDNHTSNGADYQYVMTLIATQKDKLGGNYASYMQDVMLPDLYDSMKGHGYEMTPYVYARNTPDEGIAGFLDLPRYSSGYAALHNAISFMPETHMLKPYKDRVWSTYYFMLTMINHMSVNSDQLMKARNKSLVSQVSADKMDINWAMDTERAEEFLFKGYDAKYKPSVVSGHSRLYYDRDAPYEKKIPFYNSYKPSVTIDKPAAYYIPQAYSEIIDRLKWNGVKVDQVTENQTKDVMFYYIKDYKTVDSPFEGHYLHSAVDVTKRTIKLEMRGGDYIVNMGQAKDRFIMETLEPQAPDAFFAWNFFDGILMRKEYFSPYVFEDLASKYLMENPELKKQLEKKKASDQDFAEDAYAQLNFIYERSPNYEPTFMRYPVARVE